MKVKDIERMANIAWSPAEHPSTLLAAGTAAQQFDASFSTNACLEIYSLNISDLNPEMEVKATTSTERRFHKIVWGSCGNDGIIVGGCDNGIIQIYNASKLLAGERSLVAIQNKHQGAVHALDFCTLQTNLLATGAAQSEIYISDMNDINKAIAPGEKMQPYEDVMSIQWNKQVKHILASTSVSKCTVWDLRKNTAVLTLTDPLPRIRWKALEWHPNVATQLCLASEEDQAPIIQLWDLRFATQPIKTLENHKRGILSITWCSKDDDLLISSGKDNRILCWNPNSDQSGGEVLAEIAKTSQWNFDVTWCPKNPALIASPSFDGHVSVYSLMGGGAQQLQTANNIADSFPGIDGYVQPPQLQLTTPPSGLYLSKAPKWLKRPVGASFGFSGKLVTFMHEKPNASHQNIQQGQIIKPTTHLYVSQVVTETSLIRKSEELEQALECGNFTEYCRTKTDIVMDQHKKSIWQFIRAQFEENTRAELLELLGYKQDDISSKLKKSARISNVDDVINNLGVLNTKMIRKDGFDEFEKISQIYESKKLKMFEIITGDNPEGLITEAILSGDIETAVELCIKAKKYSEALIIAKKHGDDFFAKVQSAYLKENDSSLSSLISSLVNEDWDNLVSNCDIKNWKEALAVLLTHCNDLDYPSLCEKLGNRLKQESVNNTKLAQDAQLCYICSGSFDQLVSSWSGNVEQSTEELQELMELVMFLQKAIERQGRRVEISGGLAVALARYASILSSQGSLRTALNYLGNSTTDDEVIELRNRLLVAVERQATYSQRPALQHNPNQFNSNIPPGVVQSTYQTNQFNSINAGISHNWQKQMNPPPPENPRTFSPAAPPAQPPRPTSATQAPSSGGITSRNRYKCDPSVQSNNVSGLQWNSGSVITGNISSGNAVSLQSYHVTDSFSNSPYYAPSPVAQPTLSQSNLSQTIPRDESMAYHPVPQNPPMMPSHPYRPINPVPPLQAHRVTPPPANPFVPAPLNPRTTGALPSANVKLPAAYLQTNAGQPPGTVEFGHNTLNDMYRNPTSGWNDPPTFTKPSKSQSAALMAAQDLMTAPNMMHGNQNQTPMYGQSMPHSNIPSQPTLTSPIDKPALAAPPIDTPTLGPPVNTPAPAQPVDTYNPTAFNPHSYNAFIPNAVNANMNQQQVSPGYVEKPQRVELPPIPDEHVHMQTVFNELRNRCSNSTAQPQTKRKLEEVSRRLEILYNILRERKLSADTLIDLHEIVRLAQEGNYQGGVNILTKLASGPAFSQIDCFLPGVKMLLQVAAQLQVSLK